MMRYVQNKLFIYSASHFVSTLGDAFSFIAISIITVKSTGALGDVSQILMGNIVFKLLSLQIFEKLKKKYSRKFIVILCEGLRFASPLLYFIVLMHGYNFSLIFYISILGVISSTGYGVFFNCFIPDTLPNKYYKGGYSRMQIANSAAGILSGVLSIFLLEMNMMGSFFIVSAFWYFISFLILIFFIPNSRKSKVRINDQNLYKYKDILILFKQRPDTFWLIPLVGIITMLATPLMLLIPIFASFESKSLTPYLGSLQSFICFGNVLASSCIILISKYINDFLVFYLSMIIIGGMFLSIWFVDYSFTILFLLCGFGVGVSLFNITLYTSIAKRVASSYLPTYFSCLDGVNTIMRVFCLVLISVYIEKENVGSLFIINGVLMILIAILFMKSAIFKNFFESEPALIGSHL